MKLNEVELLIPDPTKIRLNEYVLPLKVIDPTEWDWKIIDEGSYEPL